jgi:hypothetical protein
MPNLPHAIMTYDEAQYFISLRLQEVSNIKQFCKENDLLQSYQVILKIKNNKGGKQYPQVLLKLFSVLGYEAEIQTYFSLKITPNINA